MSLQLSSAAPRARLMVAESAAILKRFYYLQRELVLMQAGWVPGAQDWEFKFVLPETLWEDALIAQQLRERILELRYPDRRILPAEDEAFLAEWRSFRNAPSARAFVLGSLPLLKRYLQRAYQGYVGVADALNDGPTLRILRQAIEDIGRQHERIKLAAGTAATPDAADERWISGVAATLGDADPLELLGERSPALAFDWGAAQGRGFALARRAQRDPRFIRPLFAWPDRLDSARGPGEGLELQIRAAIHHANEVWAAEMAAAVLWDFADEAPPEFLPDAARWCYDEARHCRMGYSRLLEWGFRPEEIPIDSFSYDASAEADPLVRLGTIFYFETTYIHTKSERAKIFTRTGDRLSAHDMDFDWADELIHTHYGNRWLKHFLASRGDSRSLDAIKDEAQRLVRGLQASATELDRAATGAIHHSVLDRARALACRRGERMP